MINDKKSLPIYLLRNFVGIFFLSKCWFLVAEQNKFMNSQMFLVSMLTGLKIKLNKMKILDLCLFYSSKQVSALQVILIFGNNLF